MRSDIDMPPISNPINTPRYAAEFTTSSSFCDNQGNCRNFHGTIEVNHVPIGICPIIQTNAAIISNAASVLRILNER